MGSPSYVNKQVAEFIKALEAYYPARNRFLKAPDDDAARSDGKSEWSVSLNELKDVERKITFFVVDVVCDHVVTDGLRPRRDTNMGEYL